NLLFSTPPTTQIYTLSLHDALPICWHPAHEEEEHKKVRDGETVRDRNKPPPRHTRDDGGIKRVRDQHPDQRAGVHPRQIFNTARSEEHTSELQSRSDLVCRLLLEKK